MSRVTAYELDFVAVGIDSSRSGDAIACRVFRDDGTTETVIVDGGTIESGERLVALVREHYQTDRVDHVVNTHPDQDHASGLRTVVEQLDVGTLWMHKPWEHAATIQELLRDRRSTQHSISERLAESFSTAKNLAEAAELKGIPIEEPFAGRSVGPFTILHPSRDRYCELLSEATSPTYSMMEAIKKARSMLKNTTFSAAERWYVETLSSRAETSPTNETSTVLCAEMVDDCVLLTGDVGVRGLADAADLLERVDRSLSMATVIQIPHHGSRNNVTPEILDRLVGPIQPSDHRPSKKAFVSAAAKSDTHPRRVVTNAFRRRGATVYRVTGSGIRYAAGAVPQRMGWGPIEPVPFFDRVESD